MPKTQHAPLEADAESVPSSLRIVCDDAATITLAAAETPEEGKPSLRKFSMTAYTGGAMRLGGWPYPVVVDLAGMRVTRKSRPILKDHDRGSIVGHTDDIAITDKSLEVAGVISGVGATAQEVIATSENGFPWQASLGASADKVVFIPEGKTANANGREFKGPVYVARKSTLGEVSFVALGADDDTEARVAAGNYAEGDDPGDTDEETDDLEPVNASLNMSTKPKTENKTATTSPVNDMRAEAAAESRRIAGIRKVCAGNHADIEADAIEQGWSTTKTELAVLRSERPKAPEQTQNSPRYSREVLEAAACLSVGIEEKTLLASYGEKTLNAANPLRHIGLRELVAECARMEGIDVPRVFGDGTATIRAGFSSMSLPSIMENVMNKTLLAAYQNTPIAAFDLCSVGTVTDFKEVARYRLLGTGGFEQVAPDGELKHGKLSDQKFSNKADTYGQILTLTRHDIINDDLSAFMDIPRQMGRSGAESIDDLFFTLLLKNTGFFSSGNANLLSGADTKFGPDALTVAKTTFRKQKAGPGGKPKDQKPINIRPEYLVVPVELETEAELLMGSSQLMIDAQGSPTKIPVDNPHRNKYRIISTPHLSDSYYTGASGTAWYLFANPNVLPAFEIVFLNGRRTPVIERVEMPPNTLGMGFRSYIDFGVNSQDHRAAVKVTGEA
ncbi:Mu-like prophage major head subunit gpT family protein [Aporhodopirellula aestuarii]|uniref:Mu-like prophage major head subunit gpT family protein n=1 Tax=Aporhodopirellula aestuarii TaxID=2950107 RepID=A0ABT0U1C2_9BACT|nr:Mu-like prophage major head subunit gpT family protein [Aporhodopirellula aestuarii]MCM2370681.1 Mu-like prophage major head subunit gpT family protein [Aporhodopirellula aestuarii]